MSEKLRDIRLLVEGYSGCMNDAAKENQLKIIIAVANTEPKHETVEEWEKRTGEIYPDDGPVWVNEKTIDMGKGSAWMGWFISTYDKRKHLNTGEYWKIIVANHHGKPS
jgi:hypothetical protein